MREYSLGLYEKSMPHSLSLREKLEKTRVSGFDFLELSIDESDEKLSRLQWDSTKRWEVISAISDSGLSIGSMCLSAHRKFPLGSIDESTRKRSMDIMVRAIDLAYCWSIRIIQLAGYDVYYEQGSERTEAHFLDNLAKCTEAASKAGMILAFETMETAFMDTVEKAMYYVKMINSPYLQVYPDLGNLTNASLLYDHPVVEDLEKGKGHIVAMHLKETVPGKYRDITYGTGHTNFFEGVEAARQLGVQRFVGEFWDDGTYEKQITHANTFLRGFLDKTWKGDL